MGQEIKLAAGSADDMNEFMHSLREETALLAKCFEDGRFASCSDGHTVGSELEMWLVDENFQALGKNKSFLEKMADPLLVPELSKFNAEFNALPERIGGGSLQRMAHQMTEKWQQIQSSMREMKGHMLTIGTLPTLEDEQLCLEHMSEFDRYRALNKYIFHLRRGKPIHLSIKGHEQLESIHHDIMLEAAATSFQVHIQAPYELMTGTYNAAVLISFASVALAANSPFLLGADLWEESRIPLFEQAICLPGFTRLDGTRQQRVTFGSAYVQESLMELFWENAHAYPVLLPIKSEAPPEAFAHVALQNNTIWRWNRPVLGFGLDGKASLRVEHRVMSAGPSVEDMVADLAFVLGACHELAPRLGQGKNFLPFAKARSNFYAAAKYGLKAKVSWGPHDELLLQSLLLDELLPAARRGLKSLQISSDEISHYLDHIIEPRVKGMKTGAAWQRQWVDAHGKDWAGLTAAYFENQESRRPVHSWKI